MPQGRLVMLTVHEAAAILEMSENGARKLDSVLHPRRAADGRRIYDSDVVERVRAIRAARKAPLAKRRATILARVDHARGRK